jgi:integrase/recombinase XerD
MSQITFHPELDSYVKKNGTQTVQIRVTQFREMKRIGMGFSVLAKDWNAEKKNVRASDPHHRQKNALLKAKLIELEQAHLNTSLQGRTTTPDQLIRKIKKEILSDSFWEYATAHIAELDSPASRTGQTSLVKKFKDFMKGKELLFSEIDHLLLNRYRKHLKKIGNSPNTIQSNFAKLRGIYNEAVRAGHFKPENGIPFDMIKLKKQKSRRGKLTAEEIEKIWNHELREDIHAFHAKNLFLFSYYTQGIRFSDVVQLTWSHIRDGRYEYMANKTEKVRSTRLHPRAAEILAIYQMPGAKADEYIFPFLKGKKRGRYTEDDWYKLIQSVNAQVRGNLGKIAIAAGVPHFSMHTARHSFANIARKKTGDIYAISEALNHSSVSVTENYFGSGEDDENDAFADQVYGE